MAKKTLNPADAYRTSPHKIAQELIIHSCTAGKAQRKKELKKAGVVPFRWAITMTPLPAVEQDRTKQGAGLCSSKKGHLGSVVTTFFLRHKT